MTDSPEARERRVELGGGRRDGPGSTESADPLRRLARERGGTLGELGVSPGDTRWARAEADAIASLLRASFSLRLPGTLAAWLRRIRRAFR